MQVKIFFLAMFVLLLVACHHHRNQKGGLKNQIDSLSKRVDSVYTPGLGEFMTSIQLHHAKLWFAGKNENWELANFEMGEIREELDNIQRYNQDRPETKSLSMINTPMDSLQNSIKGKNLPDFKKHFLFLTNTCNNCHQITKHGFNVIRIPDIPPVTNQVFEKN